MWKKEFRALLKGAISKGQGASSLRAFSKRVGMSAGSISEIISGKRALSERAAKQLLEALHIDSDSKQHFLEVIEREQKGERKLLAKDAEILLSNVYFSAILCLFELQEGPLTLGGIGKRLGLSDDKVQWAVDQLVRLRMLERNGDGTLKYTGSYWTTTDQISSEAVKKAHSAELHLAERALGEIHFAERDFTSITFAGNTRQLQRVRKEIRRFRDRVSSIMEEGDVDQVYKFNIQLYPLAGFKFDD